MKIRNKKIDVALLQECKEECDVDIIVPSFKDRLMSVIAAKSFFKFENDIKIKVIFVDVSGKKDLIDLDRNTDRVTLISAPNEKFSVSKTSGAMSHSNAYSLELGRRFCTSKYVFVCHNDVLAYRKNWLSFLYSKMDQCRLSAFLRDNIRIKAAHVSGFMYDRKFYDRAGVEFWPKDKPERDVGDDFTYHLQRAGKPYYVCECSHNNPKLLKSIHKRFPELKSITADKCLDDNGNVVYLHTGRGTVKMLGRYKKPNRTTYKEWIKFAKTVI